MSSERLSIEGLWVEGQAPSRVWLPIARDVSVAVQAGEIVSLIGESGAGKTTVALSALGYCRPGTRFAAGRVLLGDTDLLSLDSRALRGVRGRRVAYVAQSASAALNPRILIGKQLVEGLLEPFFRPDQLELAHVVDEREFVSVAVDLLPRDQFMEVRAYASDVDDGVIGLRLAG